MLVLLPLNNNQSATTENRGKLKTGSRQSHELPETQQEDLEVSKPVGSCKEGNSNIELPVESTSGVLLNKEITAAAARSTEEQLHPEFEKKASIAVNRKRDHPPSETAVASASLECTAAVSGSSTKRSRITVATSGTDDSKPPAKPMVAPKRQLPTSNDELHTSVSHWEENEPTPFGNSPHYYRNHPRNNPRFASTTPTGSSFPHEESSATAVIPAAAPTNCNDPALGGEEAGFVAALKNSGLEIVEQDGDGNCLFRAVGLQVYGDASMHGQVREQCLNFMAVNKEHFGQFMTSEEPFESYITRKRQIGVHGNNPEIQAISELFNRPVEIFSPSTGAKPLNIFHKEYTTADAPIRLSYHDNNHYNAVIDPTTPTAGLGLGLPGLQPGLADKLQIAAATAESDVQCDLDEAITASQKDYSKFDDDQFQRALKESSFSVDSLYKNKAIALSDVDATNFELEQTILETSLQSYFASTQEEEGRKQRASPADRRRRPQPQSPPRENDIQDPEVSASSELRRPPVAAAAAVASCPSPEHQSSFASSSPSSDRGAMPAIAQIQSAPLSASSDEYPSAVQELVMNGFELQKVVHAYELIGDKFDDLLAFLMSTGTS